MNTPIGFFGGLILTAAVYFLPIAFYRYVIIDKPVPPRKAKIIAIIYAVIAFVAMSAILYGLGSTSAAGGSIIIWSFINYYVLKKGYTPPVVETSEKLKENQDEQNNNTDVP